MVIVLANYYTYEKMSDPDTCNARLCNYGRAGGAGDVYSGWDATAEDNDNDPTGHNTDTIAESLFNQLKGTSDQPAKYKESFNTLREAANHLSNANSNIMEQLRQTITDFDPGDDAFAVDFCLSTKDIYTTPSNYAAMLKDDTTNTSAADNADTKATDNAEKKEGFRRSKRSNYSCIGIAIIVGVLVGLLLVLGLYVYKRWIRNMKHRYVKPIPERLEWSDRD